MRFWRSVLLIGLLPLVLAGCQTTAGGVDSGGQTLSLSAPRQISAAEADIVLDALKGYEIQKVVARTRDNAHVMQTITLAKGQGVIVEERMVGSYVFANESSFPANDPDLFIKMLNKYGYSNPEGAPTKFVHKRGIGQGFYAYARAKNGVRCFVAFGGYTFGNALRGLNPHNYQTLVTVHFCASSPNDSALIFWLGSLDLRP